VKFPGWFAVLAALIILAPSVADARAGGGTGSGSRGSRTNQAPPPTQTAPTAKPIERSTTPPQQEQAQRQPGAGLSAPSPPPAPGGSFFSRHPFLSGMMGGFLGAGLFGMLFGHGMADGLGGMAGLFGLLLQIVLVGGLVYFGLRLYRAWAANRARSAPAYVYTGANSTRPLARLGGMLPAGGSASLATGAIGKIAIVESDYRAFEARLAEIQAAYSAADVGRLRGLATAEMSGYFAEELATNAGRGVEDKIEAVKLEQGDLAEAWREGNVEYATVAMRFSLIDYTRRVADGVIVAGSDRVRSEATEIWTFVRDRGGPWLLSAIRQA
jgi:predicted lipid-binding transport protein (Tim44 family)